VATHSPDGQTSYDAPLQPDTYTGREWEPAANLYYYRLRFLDPQKGRFICQDPLGLLRGANPYSYVSGNPFGFIDPFGLSAVPVAQQQQSFWDYIFSTQYLNDVGWQASYNALGFFRAAKSAPCTLHFYDQ
jgi:RHS repeat-associated protein